MAEAGQDAALSVDTTHNEVTNISSRFTDIHPVGYGANGLVYSATDKECEKKVAIKKLSFHDKWSCKRALREIRIMRQMAHENVITVYEILTNDGSALNLQSVPNLNELKCVFIVQELLDTDLNRLVQHGLLTPDHIKFFLYQLLRGIKYIHSANVIHRDLKPSNLLINCDDLVLKITDFGLSRVVDPNYDHKGHLTDNIGACWYRSPELIITPKCYAQATDMWSVGCIFAEMLLGKTMFPGTNELDQLLRIIDTAHLTDSDWDEVLRVMPNKMLKNHPLHARTPLRGRLDNVDPAAVDLLEKMLTFNSNNRLTAEEALVHPYLAHYSMPEDEPVAEHPFCIEAEIDDIPMYDLRKSIFNESIAAPNRCGGRITNMAAGDQDSNTGETAAEPCQEETLTLGEILQLDPTAERGDNDDDRSPQDRVAMRNFRNVQESDHSEGATRRTSPDIFHIEDTAAGEAPAAPWPSGTKFMDDDDEEYEKDVAEFSPRKLEEDLEVGNIDSKPAEEEEEEEEEGRAHDLTRPLTLNVEDTENMKEFSQPSPKDTAAVCNSQSAHNQHSTVCNHCTTGHPQRPLLAAPSRAGTPNSRPSSAGSNHDQDNLASQQKKVEMQEKQKLKEEHTRTVSRKLILDKIQSEKNASASQAEQHPDLSSEEFDELYRLPTEHLRVDRDYSNLRLRQKLIAHTKTRPSRLREEINERRRKKEEPGYEGACGGADCPEEPSPQYDSDDTAQATSVRLQVVSPSVVLCPVSTDVDLELDVPPPPVPQPLPQRDSLRIASLGGAAGQDPLSSPEAPSSPRSTRSGARPKKSPRKQRAL